MTVELENDHNDLKHNFIYKIRIYIEFFNNGLFYFRDNMGNEVDLIIEKETGPLAIEIKSAKKPDQK